MAAVEATAGQPDDVDSEPEVITEVAPPSVEDDPGSAFMNRLRSADITEDQLKQRAIELGSTRAVAWPKTHSAMFELVLQLECARALRDFPNEADAVRARESRASKAALETLCGQREGFDQHEHA